jgi:hypothetical protein
MMSCHALPRPAAAARFMDEQGYYISLESFKGPFLDAAAVQGGTSKLPWNNIFCVRKRLVDAKG